ncbi:phage neck terminator protein [Virgibacillus sediminis]|uniref:LIC_12616 family protein n=1 Tax=Virgibacillus sediminis TaxID=202260 RepID=A0ABV7A692_9BACI
MTLEVRNNLIQALYNHLNIPIIPDDDDGSIPPRPYVVYSVTSDNQKNGSDSITYTETDTGFTKTYANQKEASYSFNAHSDSRDEALEICYNLIEYFERIGRDILNDKGIAVAEVSTTQNRSVLLGEHYERRHGFDVRIRYVDRSEYEEEPIEELNL